MRDVTIASAIAIAGLAVAAPASGGEIWVEQRLIAEDGQGNDLFGFRVLVSGDTAFVSAPAPGSRPGRVYVLERSNGVWTHDQILTATPNNPPPPGWSDFFGWSLSLSGDTLIVGAPLAFHPQFGPVGAAYVFTRSEDTWTQQQELTSAAVQPNQWFGVAAALAGETAVVGAYNRNGGVGAAFVFDGSGGTWTEAQELTAGDGDSSQFGSAIALDGTTLLIGASGPDFTTGQAPVGAAYVFAESEGSWTQTQRLTGASAPGDQFGFSLALSGTTALVGAPQQDVGDAVQPGAVHVFAESAGTWTQVQELTVGDGEDYDQFGQSVALQGDSALIGEWSRNGDPGGEQPPPKPGAAHLFVRSGGAWSLDRELMANDHSDGDSFGWSVAIDGSTLMVGATGTAPAGSTFQGAAYAYSMPAADHGIVEGTVLSLGHCGADPAPLAGATVELAGVDSTVTLQAEENGFYQAALPEAESPIDVTVTAPGHLPSTVTGIVLSAGETVTLDLQLALEAPCATTDPDELAVTLGQGQSTTQTLTIGNADGNADLAWTLTTVLPPAAGAAPDRSGTSSEDAAPPLPEPWTRPRLASESVPALPSVSPLAAARDLASALHPLRSVRPLVATSGGIDCDGAPGLIVHDDGTVENGYSSNTTQVSFADHFTPLAYPAPLSAVCLAFLTTGPTSLDFEIVVLDDDGTDGGPGTELGALPVTADGIPGAPGTPAWFGFDISSLGITIESGSVYIGARWAPANPGVFVAVDESAGQPVGFAGGYWWHEVSNVWSPIESTFFQYRSLFVRAVTNPAGCNDPAYIPWLSLDPASGVVPAGGVSEVEVGLDAGALSPGVYEANLCLESNDPLRPLVVISVDLTVTEGTASFAPTALEVDSEKSLPDGNGVFEPGEQVEVAPEWTNDGTIAGSLAGMAANFMGPGNATYTLVEDAADYGTLEPGQTASCRDSGVCYLLEIDDPAARPATHWEATFDETLSDTAGTTRTWTLHIGDSFTDVPRESLFYPWIETLLHHRVTGGCADATYCPAAANTRGQMAVFLLKASEGGDYLPPACVEGEEVFADVSFDNLFCPWIEELAGRSVTAGCGGGNYCPNASVNRDQMAVFLLKTLEGSGYAPPACSGVFGDVPCPSLFANWVEDLVARGITAGCGGGNYCPANPVSRDQMAVFLSKTFGLVLYGP